MLFSSIEYILLFLPVVTIVYFVLNRNRFLLAGKIWLIAASLFFYGFWNPAYLILIVGSILLNFGIGTAIKIILARQDVKINRLLRPKTLLIIGIVFNLGLLGYYKYADFLIQNINQLASTDIQPLALLLPLAISFFTFQQIAYLVDCYKGRTQENDFLNYCLFVTFFPQLIAGPIVHHWDMMPQYNKLNAKLVNWKNIVIGSIIFSLGLFKKVVIADSFAVWANAGFDTGQPLTLLEGWGTSLSYTFQLYYDFSGYTDMAIGAALLFNIRLPQNFNSPYKAVNIQDFWRRWHITLSHWLRDYIYIPLGGSRKGPILTYMNLFVTFLLGGLWHGAGWTFILWGGMHGAAICIHRMWLQLGFKLHRLLGWFLTFMFVNITWVVFRATSLEDAVRILKSMFDVRGLQFSNYFIDSISAVLNSSLPRLLPQYYRPPVVIEWVLVLSAGALIAVTSSKNTIQIRDQLLTSRTLNHAQFALLSLIVGIALSGLAGSSSEVFLYFNF